MSLNSFVSDDVFKNIDLSADPEITRLTESDRYAQITNLQAISHLNGLDSIESRIDFSSDSWDFQPFLQRGEKASNPVLYFEDVPQEMKLYLKFFANYFRKKENLKISTLYLRIAAIKSVIHKILKNIPDISFEGITTRMIVNEIESRNLARYSAHGYFYALYRFYDYLVRICKVILLVDPNELNKHDDIKIKESKQIDTRLPNIPKDIAVAIRTKALDVMADEGAEYRYRLVACAIVMLFNLGVRINDLLDFRVNDLQKEATEVDGYKISYITYYIQKLSRHNSEAFGHTIYASKECVQAFETMINIRKTQAAVESLDYLFVYGGKVVSRHKFGNEFYPLYMYVYHPDICTTDKYHEVFTPNSSCALSPINNKPLYFPDTRQYRVWLCNDLYAKGVSWAFVEEHLKHISQAMMSYYNRPEDRTPEYVAFAENVFETMLVEKVNPIGIVGPKIRDEIMKFLDSKKFNIADDWDSILNVLGDKVSIRAKTGGFCFKTSLIPCAQEKGTDPLLCAYNLCPNVYSFYYNVDYTYFEFKSHVEAFEQNAIKGLWNTARKELVEIQSLIARSLKPQIAQLEEELLRTGFEEMAEKHPNIIDVVKGLTDIKKEIKEWSTKKIVK